MRILVFSDVHGNIIALEKMLSIEPSIGNYIFLGDAVNYGPWSNECVDLIESLPNCIKIKGNHEEYFLSKKFSGEHPTAEAFFEFCIDNFDRNESIKKYQDRYELNGWNFCHSIQNMYVFPDSDISIDQNFVIGHSHYSFIKICNNHLLCNVGSVGQNRTFINKLDYTILDMENNSIEFKSWMYDIDKVINEMKVRKYPKICISYYKNKKRA